MNIEIFFLISFFIVCLLGLYKFYSKVTKLRDDVNILLIENKKIAKDLNEARKKIVINQVECHKMLNEVNDNIQKIQLRKKLLITGCGRSGTTYIARVLNKVGVNIAHEKCGEDGIASWYMAAPGKKIPFNLDSRIGYDFEYTLHQVRNPVDVIASAQTLSEESWNYIGKFINIEKNDSTLMKCAKYWYYWNLLAEKRSLFTYRIENIELELPKILDIIKIGRYDDIIKSQSTQTNTRKHDKISLEDVKKEDEKLYNNIVNLAIRYGYSIKDLNIR